MEANVSISDRSYLRHVCKVLDITPKFFPTDQSVPLRFFSRHVAVQVTERSLLAFVLTDFCLLCRLAAA